MDHAKMMRQFGDHVGREAFVYFVIHHALQGIKKGEEVKGLGRILVLGGGDLEKEPEREREIESPGATKKEALRAIDRVFDRLDWDKNGRLDREELNEFGELLESRWTRDDAKRYSTFWTNTIGADRRKYVEREDFRDFMAKALLDTFDRLGGGRDRLDSDDLRPVSKELDLDHREMMRDTQESGVDRATWVYFVMTHMFRDLKKGKLLRGFGKILTHKLTDGAQVRPSDAVNAIHNFFDRLDVDGNGYLDKREVHELGESLDRAWSKANTERLMKMLNPRNSSRVQREDFVTFTQESLLSCFDKLANGRSKLDSDDLRVVSREMDLNHRDMMREFDGGVDKATFVFFIMSQAMKGVKRGKEIAGLGKILVLGGDGMALLAG